MNINTENLNYEQIEMIALEGFLRRACKYNLPFMLKGSYVTRQYMPNMQERMPEDIDWLYFSKDKITTEEANKIFTKWMIDVTETELDDGVKFTSFSENAFWRGIDYAMDDDFPTVNTDIEYTVNDKGEEASLDISFNLDLDVEPVPLLYKPMLGEAFTIPYTPPLSLQVAWKLHQTIVRARFKDLYDLSYLLQHPSYDSKAANETLQALVNECYKDKIDNDKILNIFSKKEVENLYNNELAKKDTFKNYYSHLYDDYYFKKYIGDVNISATKERWYKFAEQFYTLLNNVGINEKISLPKPTRK